MIYASNAYKLRKNNSFLRYQTKWMKIFDTNTWHAIIVGLSQFGESDFSVKLVKILTFVKVICEFYFQTVMIRTFLLKRSFIQLTMNTDFWRCLSLGTDFQFMKSNASLVTKIPSLEFILIVLTVKITNYVFSLFNSGQKCYF